MGRADPAAARTPPVRAGGGRARQGRSLAAGHRAAVGCATSWSRPWRRRPTRERAHPPSMS